MNENEEEGANLSKEYPVKQLGKGGKKHRGGTL